MSAQGHSAALQHCENKMEHLTISPALLPITPLAWTLDSVNLVSVAVNHTLAIIQVSGGFVIFRETGIMDFTIQAEDARNLCGVEINKIKQAADPVIIEYSLGETHDAVVSVGTPPSRGDLEECLLEGAGVLVTGKNFDLLAFLGRVCLHAEVDCASSVISVFLGPGRRHRDVKSARDEVRRC